MTAVDDDRRSGAGSAARSAGRAAARKGAKVAGKKVAGKLGIKAIAAVGGSTVGVILLVLLLLVVLAAVLGANKTDASAGGCGPVSIAGASSSLTEEQNANAQAIAGVALGLGLGERGVLVGITTALTESTLKNVDYGDMMGPGGSMSSSRGLFQQLTGWGPLADRMDPVRAATMFYTGGQAGQPGLMDIPGWHQMSVPAAAQSVQMSEFADGSNFAGNLELAQVITAALLGSTGTPGTPGTSAGARTPGAPAAATPASWCSPAGGGDTPVLVNGVAVTIPDVEFVLPELRGYVLQAPTAGLATGLAAGFGSLGLPYVWGGGADGGGPDDGCSRGGGDLNSCQGLRGFDCSGFTGYILKTAGFQIPGNSAGQRGAGQKVSWDQGLPGDIIGFPGHVAIYLGTINGTRYLLEASTVGVPLHVKALTRGDYDNVLYRYWS